jgi:hypothetical protein
MLEQAPRSLRGYHRQDLLAILVPVECAIMADGRQVEKEDRIAGIAIANRRSPTSE